MSSTMIDGVASSPEWIDTKDVAVLIRKRLKAEFPGTKFSVRIDRYAGGSAVNISWTDGPTEPQVRDLTSAYQGRGFDGMIDLSYGYTAWLLPDGSAQVAETEGTQGSMGSVPARVTDPPSPGARLVRFGSSHVGCYREISDGAKAKIREEITQATGVVFPATAREEHSVEVPWTTFVDDDGEVKLSYDPNGYGRHDLGSLVHQMAYRRDLS